MTTIRASSLPSYCDCPRRALIRLYPDQVPALRRTPQNIGALVGTGFHAGCALTLNGKLTGVTVTAQDAEEVGIESLRSALAADATEYDSTTPRQNDAEQQIRTMQAIFRQTVEPRIEPALPAEYRRKATITLPGSGAGAGSGAATIEITGAIDTETTGGAILDFKTGRLRNHFGQMGLYSLLRKTERADHLGATGLQIIHFPRVRVSAAYPGPKVHDYPVAIAERQAWAVIGWILQDMRVAERDITAVRCNPQSQICSPRYCPAWGTGACEITIAATRQE